MFRQFRVAALALGLAVSLPQVTSASIMTFELGSAYTSLDLTGNSPYSGVSFIGRNSGNTSDVDVFAVVDPDDPTNGSSNVPRTPAARIGNHAVKIEGAVTIVTSGFKFKGVRFDWYDGFSGYAFENGGSCSICFGSRTVDFYNSNIEQTLWGKLNPDPSASGYQADAEYWNDGNNNQASAVLVNRITFSAATSYIDNIELLGVELDNNNNAPEPSGIALVLAALSGVAVTRCRRPAQHSL